MNIRNLTAVVLIPLIVLVSVTPAHAIFGSILAGIQRAQMIVNQGIQITNQVRQITTMGGQLTELKDQFRHLKDQALGSVGALTPIVQRSGVRAQRPGQRRGWDGRTTSPAKPSVL